MKKYTLYFLLLLFIVACTNPSSDSTNKTTTTEEKKALSFDAKTLTTESATCATDSVKCASVSIRYLVAQDAPKEVLQHINDTLNWYFTNAVTSFGEDDFTADVSLDEAANTFIAEYDTFLEEMAADNDTEYITPWTIEVNSSVEHVSDQTACIMMGTYSYTGGAHPNYFSSLFNFDNKTGKKLTEDDMIKNKSALLKIAEAAFRKTVEISPTDNLEEAGYFWGEDFGLPQNMGLVQEGLKLYYNPYEIAPYALGPTEFVIPYADLEGVVNW